jgi:hypothetical protein
VRKRGDLGEASQNEGAFASIFQGQGSYMHFLMSGN